MNFDYRWLATRALYTQAAPLLPQLAQLSNVAA